MVAEEAVDTGGVTGADGVTPNPTGQGEPSAGVETPGEGSGVGAVPAGGAALDDREREILAFEHLRWTTPGAKEEEIRRRFGVEPWRYFQQLNALIDRAEAQEEDPRMVRILRERRD